MSAPISKAYNIQLVRIQSGKRLAITPEQTFAPDRVTCLREAKGKGYRATTQVKGLSPEIISVSVDDAFHFCGSQNSHNRYWQGYADPMGSKDRCAISK